MDLKFPAKLNKQDKETPKGKKNKDTSKTKSSSQMYPPMPEMSKKGPPTVESLEIASTSGEIPGFMKDVLYLKNFMNSQGSDVKEVKERIVKLELRASAIEESQREMKESLAVMQKDIAVIRQGSYMRSDPKGARGSTNLFGWGWE